MLYKFLKFTCKDDLIEDCYLGLLGRNSDPDGKKSAKKEIASGSFSKILAAFIQSPEFTSKFANKNGFSLVGLDHPAIKIDNIYLEKDELKKLIYITSNTWNALGEKSPEYSVLSSNHFDRSFGEIRQREFYESGYSEVRQLESILKRNGFDINKFETCVEFGCGIGRITLPLAEKIKEVIAYDISGSHLEIAKKNLEARSIKNVRLEKLKSHEQMISSCDLFYSRIVFQHNPPPLIHKLIDNSLAALKVGGVAVFQVPTYIPEYRFNLNDYFKDTHESMELHCIPQRNVLDLIYQNKCRLLEIREDASVGSPSTYISNTFIVQKQ